MQAFSSFRVWLVYSRSNRNVFIHILNTRYATDILKVIHIEKYYSQPASVGQCFFVPSGKLRLCSHFSNFCPLILCSPSSSFCIFSWVGTNILNFGPKSLGFPKQTHTWCHAAGCVWRSLFGSSLWGPTVSQTMLLGYSKQLDLSGPSLIDEWSWWRKILYLLGYFCRNFFKLHKLWFLDESKFHKSNSPLKFNIDTNNGGLENVSPASNIAWFWVSMLNFRGSLASTAISHQWSLVIAGWRLPTWGSRIHRVGDVLLPGPVEWDRPRSEVA